jgi:hypothetical protein
MIYRAVGAALLCMGISASLLAQVSRDAKFELLRKVIAEQAAARIAMPFGTEGVELTDSGTINQQKLDQQIRKSGASIEPGKVVSVTGLDIEDNSIVVELDGGGKNSKKWYERIQVGVGSQTTPVSRDNEQRAKGSKVVLKFAKKVPEELTPDQLKELLDPVLDFNKHNFLKTGLESLPPEFQEAVKAKEARIGMDRSTVLMALGRPSKKVRETVDGVEQEDWIYNGPGLHAQFVTFADNVVIKIKQY